MNLYRVVVFTDFTLEASFVSATKVYYSAFATVELLEHGYFYEHFRNCQNESLV